MVEDFEPKPVPIELAALRELEQRHFDLLEECYAYMCSGGHVSMGAKRLRNKLFAELNKKDSEAEQIQQAHERR